MRLYVGNLSYDVTEEDLLRLFKAYGQIDNVIIIEDKVTGVLHRYSLIDLPDKREAISAIEALNRCKLQGQRLFVHRARVVKDRRNSGRGGGRRRTDRPESKPQM